MSTAMFMEPLATDARETDTLHFLGHVDGLPLLWDMQEHCPVWPEDEPQTIIYEADGSITIEFRCDVYQLPSWVRQPRPLDCGHSIGAGQHYISWHASQQDTCVACGVAS